MTAQAKRKLSIISIYAGMAAFISILGYICKAQELAYNVAIKPAVERTVAAAITDSINRYNIRMEKIEKKQCLTDTNILIIKSILEVMATNDQLVKANERRSNPTGIR